MLDEQMTRQKRRLKARELNILSDNNTQGDLELTSFIDDCLFVSVIKEQSYISWPQYTFWRHFELKSLAKIQYIIVV